MKKLFLIASGVWLVTGCGGSDAISPTGQSAGPDSRPSTLDVTMPGSSLDSGSVITVTATPRDGNGAVIAGGTVVWKSSDLTVAKVVADGPRTALVTALLPGSFEISAALNGITGTLRANVLGDASRGVSAAFIYEPGRGMTFIPLPAGATGLNAFAINDSGQVVGQISFASASSHAFLWSKKDGMKDLGALPGSLSTTMATAISPNGQVTGWGTPNKSWEPQPFKWTAQTGMVQLALATGLTQAQPTGINDAGQIVGGASRIYVDNTGRVFSGGQFAFLWSAARGMEILGSPAGAEGAAALAINAKGDIAGGAYSGDEFDGGVYNGAILWPAAGTPLVGAKRFGSHARSLNSAGILGGSDGFAPATWTSSGTLLVTAQSLPVMGDQGSVTGINDKGTLVGTWNSYSGSADQSRGFFWTALTGYSEIPMPASRQWMYVTGVNNKDQIVGYVN